MQAKTMTNQINSMLEGVGVTIDDLSNQEMVQKVKTETERGFGSIFRFVKDTVVGCLLGIMLTVYMTFWIPMRNLITCYTVSERGLQKHVIKK